MQETHCRTSGLAHRGVRKRRSMPRSTAPHTPPSLVPLNFNTVSRRPPACRPASVSPLGRRAAAPAELSHLPPPDVSANQAPSARTVPCPA
ncbi:hypothetical protein GJAV_G00230840 [Gymnothorax javanicus]|nr:hypothetical protein GJAV_G00230840 [Gymnothorax javanicus]